MVRPSSTILIVWQQVTKPSSTEKAYGDSLKIWLKALELAKSLGIPENATFKMSIESKEFLSGGSVVATETAT